MAYIPRSSSNTTEMYGAIPLQVQKRRTIHVFSLTATILLVCSVLVAAGSFFYTNFLTSGLEAAQSRLNTTSKIEDQKKVEEIRIYDEKLKIAQNLLNNHIAPSLIFQELEDSTKETVQLEGFAYTYDPGFEAAITLTGNTEEFASLALQKMQYYKENIFSEFVMEGISVASEDSDQSLAKKESKDDSKGKVSFTITGVFKKGILDYVGETPATERVTNATPTTPITSATSSEEMPSPEEIPTLSTSTVEDTVTPDTNI